MKVIFIRHGKAEEYSFSKPDPDRELTKEGRKDLEKNMPYLVDKLDFSSTKVFSSPLIRAYQTTDYVTQDYELVDFLATGDLDELKDCVKAHAHYETMVFVGHEPILSEWIFSLTGEMMTVKKGMAVFLNWPDKVLTSARLKDYQSL